MTSNTLLQLSASLLYKTNRRVEKIKPKERTQKYSKDTPKITSMSFLWGKNRAQHNLFTKTFNLYKITTVKMTWNRINNIFQWFEISAINSTIIFV